VIKGAIDRIEVLARVICDETTATLAHELAEQVPRDELNLLVVGQFKRGKSSLVNALLGADVMPTGALPLTGVATVTRYGDERRIDVLFRHRTDRREILVDELPLYVSEQCNPANRLGVERVEVIWPSETIRGLALFDTPGIGSTYVHNTAAARAALPRADAAVLVVGPEPPIGADELRYAREVVASSEHLFVVLNKSDIAGKALPEILQFTRDAVKQVVGERENVEIVPLSVTRARDAQRAGGEDPAFADFVDSLRSFVEQRGSATRERSVRRRATAILQRLDALLAMRSTALALPRTERERRKALVARALQTVDDRVRSLELMVDDDVRRLRLALEEAMDRFHDRDEPRFRTLAAAISKEPSAQRRGDRLEIAVAERAAAWRKDAVEQAARQLQLDAAKYGRLLGEIEASALEAGCEVLHVNAGELAPRNVEFAPAKLELIASLMPTTGLELVVAFAIDLLPAPLREPILKRRYDHVLARELDALRGKLRYGIAHDLEPWRRSVRATISSSIESVRHAVLAAFGELTAETDTTGDQELEQVRGLQREVAGLRAALEAEPLLAFEKAASTSAS
jgi:GTPase SAR1 family protein